MKIPVTPQFRADQERHNLRYTCDHCSFYLRQAKQCAHEWPNMDHHRQAVTEIVFCKEFELR